MLFLPLTFLYWVLLRYTRTCCDYTCGGTFWGVCGVGLFCYGTVVVVAMLVYFDVIFQVQYATRDSVLTVLWYMLGVLLLLVWGFIQYTCLHKSYQEYQLQLERQSLGLPTARIFPLSSVNVFPRDTFGCAKFAYYANIVGNAVLGVCFVAAEVLILDQLESAKKDDSTKLFVADLYISVFLLLVMVVFIPLSASLIRTYDKYMYILVFVGFVPAAILAGLYHPYIKDQENIDKLIRMLMTVLPLFALYVSFLSYLRNYDDDLYRAFLTVSGIGFVLPLGLGYTFYSVDHYAASDGPVLASVVVASVCGAVAFIYFLVHIVVKIRQSCMLRWKFKNSDCVGIGMLGNFGIGLLCIGALVYAYVDFEDASTVKRTIVFAMVFLISFLIVCISIVLRIQLPKNVTDHNLNLYYLR